MKIALVHDQVGGPAGGGGGVRQMLELGLALDELGHEVVVLCHDFEPGTEFGDASQRLEVRAVRVGEVRHPKGQREVSRRLFRGMAAVAKLAPSDLDVVNAHEWPALHAGRLAARAARTPFVWTRNDETMWERGLIPDETIVVPPRRRGRLAHLALSLPDLLDARGADRIVVLDFRNARMVERAYGRDATVIRSGPARHFFDAPERSVARELLGVPPDEFVVLGMAILYPHRRFEDLIEATALMDGAGPPARTLIAGSDHGAPAYADRLERLIADRGLRDRVRLTRSGLSDDDLRLHYAAADAFVFPNRRQTWGLAPLEALAARTPVVVSRGAGVHEVLEGRPGVVVVPPEDPRALARALSQLRDGPPDGLEETRAWIRTELSSRRYAEQVAQLFAELA